MHQKLIASSSHALLSFLCVTLAACSGGSSSSSPGSSVATQEGIFIDSPVQGLRYDAGSGVQGITDEQGRFRYVMNTPVEFFVGNVSLGKYAPANIVTPLNLISASGSPPVSLTSMEFINRLRLLQGLDIDNNPANGISLPQFMNLPGQPTVNFSVSNGFDQDSVVNQLLALVPGGAGRTLPTGEVAAQRFESYMLENFYSGCYIGSVADVADFGQLVMQVFADGRVAGKLPTSRNSPAPSRFNGMFRGDGKFQASLEESAGTISGSVVPLVNQAVGVVEFMTTERTRQGGVLSRNPQAFPSFDTTPCREFVEESLQP